MNESQCHETIFKTFKMFHFIIQGSRVDPSCDAVLILNNVFSVPSFPTEYMIEIEIDMVYAALLNELRTLLKSFGLPFLISDFQIDELNITTGNCPLCLC